MGSAISVPSGSGGRAPARRGASGRSPARSSCGPRRCPCRAAWVRPPAALPVAGGARQPAAGPRDDLPLVALVDLGDVPAVLHLTLSELITQEAVLRREPGDAAFEVEHGPYPGEVHPHLLGETLDVASELDVLLRI